MTINTNTSASASALNLSHSQEMLSKSLARLSSGSKITQPSDDAAGLAVSERMSAQSRRIDAAGTNVQNAISYIQTADGFMSNMSNVLSRMSELTTLAKDVTKNAGDVALYQQEFQALQGQLNDTIGGPGVTTPLGSFNGIELFGPNVAGLTVTIGADANQTMNISDTNLRSGVMATLLANSGGVFTVNVTDPTANQNLIDAIQQVATERATLGASQSRLEVAANTLQIQNQNLESAISRIRDVDVAKESTEYAKHNILVQSGTAMLAQANQLPASVLKLLQ